MQYFSKYKIDIENQKEVIEKEIKDRLASLIKTPLPLPTDADIAKAVPNHIRSESASGQVYTFKSLRAEYFKEISQKKSQWSKKKYDDLQVKWDDIQNIFRIWFSRNLGRGVRKILNIRSDFKVNAQAVLEDPLVLNDFSISDVQNIKLSIETEVAGEIAKFADYHKDVQNFAKIWEPYRQIFISYYILETTRVGELEKQQIQELHDMQKQFSDMRQYFSTLTQPTKQVAVKLNCTFRQIDYSKEETIIKLTKTMTVSKFLDLFLASSKLKDMDVETQHPKLFITNQIEMSKDSRLIDYNWAIITELTVLILNNLQHSKTDDIESDVDSPSNVNNKENKDNGEK